MARSNMLCSNGGIELVPEICLRVLEFVIYMDPRDIKCLLCISKSLTSLLKSHEKSVTKRLTRGCGLLLFVNGENKIIRSSSRINAGNIGLEKYTYPWLWELRYRELTLFFLVDHEITCMKGELEGWPTLNVSKLELGLRFRGFRYNAICLLFRLSDCTAGLNSTLEIRATQDKFLRGLCVEDLATLGVMVEVMGHNFFVMMKRLVAESGLIRNSQSADTAQSESGYELSPRAPTLDLRDDIWIRETMCVFEDLVQRYGPTFARAYLENSRGKSLRSDVWARKKILEGLDNMNAFELGYTMSFASLQSVVWRIFRKKEGCTDRDSWTVAKEIVVSEMLSYRLKGDLPSCFQAFYSDSSGDDNSSDN